MRKKVFYSPKGNRQMKYKEYITLVFGHAKMSKRILSWKNYAQIAVTINNRFEIKGMFYAHYYKLHHNLLQNVFKVNTRFS